MNPDNYAQLPRSVRRLLKRVNKSDDCHICGRRYEHRDNLYVGFDGKHKLIEVGDCCATKLARVFMGGMYLAPLAKNVLDCLENGQVFINPVLREQQSFDRDWFAANPHRSHRLRLALPDEWPKEVEHSTYVAVRQIEPGSRMRLPFECSGWSAIDDLEETAWAVFDLLCEAGKRGGRLVTRDEVEARARFLTRGGAA